MRGWKRLIGWGVVTLGCGIPALSAGGHGTSAADRPNIVILFADDLGYSDIGCFGGEIDTPNLDQLAAGGMRFTQFYNTGRCCPSRACLFTGLYPHQAGVGMMVYRNAGPGYRGHLNQRCVTFGDVLHAAGYRTMMVGKWHAGHLPASLPEARGFDNFTGVYLHIDSYWKVLPNCDIYRDGQLFIRAQPAPINPYRPDDAFYTTEFFTDAAIDYIDQAAGDPERPFLLHVCFNAPHFPLEAPDDLIRKYRGRYLRGWDVLRREKFERMRTMGLLPDGQRLPQVHSWSTRREPALPFNLLVDGELQPRWDELSHQDQQELDFRRAIYAAQVDCLDQQIGRIIQRIRRRGILDNTLILFFADNGCSGELGRFGMHWGEYTESNYSSWKRKGGWSVSQGQCWATLSNTPFRRHKIYVHEGGIASPFIAHWPREIRPGGMARQPVFHLVDIMPTLCDVAGTHYPLTLGGREITPAPGISMRPYWRADDGIRSPPPPRTLYWQHTNHSAIRDGRWKLVTINDRTDDAWELYDMTIDRSETQDVADDHPEIVQRLADKWRQWARRVHAIPFPEARPKATANPLPGH